MARGKLLKTKIKEEKKLQKARWHLERKKPLDVSLREHIGKFLDRVTLDDGIKLISIISLTIIIKPMVQKLPEFTEYLKSIGPYAAVMNIITEISKPDPLGGPWFQIKNPLTNEVYWQWGPNDKKPTEPVGADVKIEPNELACWFFSFALASLIVYFGPSLLQGLGGVRGLASIILA